MNKFFHAYPYNYVGMILALTILFASYFDHYSAISKNKLVNSSFEQKLEAWRSSNIGVSLLTKPETGVRLTAPNGSTRVHISQTVMLKNERLLKISAYIKTTDVTKGDRKWKSARLTAVQNRVYPYSKKTHRTVISTQSGTTRWIEVSGIVKVWENTDSIDVVFELVRAKGTASIGKVSLVEVSENMVFILLRNCFRFGWLVVVFIVLWQGISSLENIGRRSLFFGMAFLILGGVLITASSKNALAAQFSHFIPWDFEPFYTANELIFATGHLIGFWILTLIALFPTKTVKTSIILCLNLLLFAVCTEAIQLLSEDRNASFLDGLTDTVGIIAGWLVWKLARRSKQNYPTLS